MEQPFANQYVPEIMFILYLIKYTQVCMVWFLAKVSVQLEWCDQFSTERRRSPLAGTVVLYDCLGVSQITLDLITQRPQVHAEFDKLHKLLLVLYILPY